MPKYANSGLQTMTLNPIPPTVLWPGDDEYLFGTAPLLPGILQDPNDTNVLFEAVTIGERSAAIQLAPRPGGGAPAGMQIMVVASANPGAAEIDIQEAGTDADGAYLTNTSSPAYKITVWTAIAGGQFVSWAEIQPEGGYFVTLKVIANPNAVGYTAKAIYV